MAFATFFLLPLAGFGTGGGLSAYADGPAPGFFADMDDMPVMPGLVEDLDATVVFDRPDGRIVEAAAAGPVTPAAIRQFYQAALPSLGWEAKAGASMVFRRGAERLSLDITDAGDGNSILRLSIEPTGEH